ncbi:MAG: hypothetical protein OEM26_02385 [Saprospiraceae bacterium]|jgi:hypothetical protein|nr:hypothetical protein [Saprospiraceae bacterium]
MKVMDENLQSLVNEINKLTQLLASEYPELYLHLEELPITIASKPSSQLSKSDLENYLESLQEQIKWYQATRPVSNKD